MDSRQFCSVCKQWLDMEVVPTADGDDDGVVWFRCPQCQGFLPKLGSMLAAAAAAPAAGEGRGQGSDRDHHELPDDESVEAALQAGELKDDELLADGLLAEEPLADGSQDDEQRDDELRDDGLQDDRPQGDDPRHAAAAAGRARSEAPAEPVLEYAARLAAVDPATAVPYRPWETYEVGQCVLHLAWNDCGIVVAKEALPGGRRVIKCWFQDAGVVRLIENAPR